jgi:hypothetical protein
MACNCIIFITYRTKIQLVVLYLKCGEHTDRHNHPYMCPSCAYCAYCAQHVQKCKKGEYFFPLHKVCNKSAYKSLGTGHHTLTINVQFRISVARDTDTCDSIGTQALNNRRIFIARKWTGRHMF